MPPSPRVREQHPLITEDGWRNLTRVYDHPAAPRWNFEIGDRVEHADLHAVDLFREQLRTQRAAVHTPSSALVSLLLAARSHTQTLEDRTLQGSDLLQDWDDIATISRDSLADTIASCIPRNADLTRMIVYDTSGTTGHALRVPTHPRTVALHHAIVESAMEHHGKVLRMGATETACMNVRAQRETYVFCTVFSVWKQAAFARINLHPSAWNDPQRDAKRFVQALQPSLLTGDPAVFASWFEQGMIATPDMVLSTSTQLDDNVRAQWSNAFGCPLIDWYSTTETGPIAYTAADGVGMRLAAPDVFVEVVDDNDHTVPNGTLGWIVVSVGRNPFLPLLRYRTGDRARCVVHTTKQGHSELRLLDLQGRRPVYFRTVHGERVNTVDVGRAMRARVMFVQHEMVQHGDGSLTLRVRPMADTLLDTTALREAVESVMGAGVKLDITVDATLGTEQKVIPYRTEDSLSER